MRVFLLAMLLLACSGKHREAPAPSPTTKPSAVAPRTASVTLSGAVIDAEGQDVVPNVEVVVRGAAGEISVRTSDKGEWRVGVAPGTYRLFVRDETWLSVGMQDRVRLDAVPRAELAGHVDPSLMPALDATADTSGIELRVSRAAVVSGVVSDPAGKPVPRVVVRARPADTTILGPLRPVQGTDVAISDDHGAFVVRVPRGAYVLDASHPTYAGIDPQASLVLESGEKRDAEVSLARGCIVSGRVSRADHTPVADGAIETQLDPGTFGPTGRVESDGTFRWVTLVEDTFQLRAWPWQSPPSPPLTIHCRDGKRYDHVAVELPDQRPDLSGTIVDAKGVAVPYVFINVQVTNAVVAPSQVQQERTDAAGTWHVYDLPPGTYEITASAPGGVIDTTTSAPKQDLKLQLGGTGRIVGTTTSLANGTFEVSFLHCGPKTDPIAVPHQSRLVVVRGGRFAIENAPACALTFVVRSADRVFEQEVVVDPDRAAYVELDIGAARKKHVTGIVRARDQKPVAGARVTAVFAEHEVASVRSDQDGRYTLETQAGAQIHAADGEHVGHATVGRANVASEQLDVVLDDRE